MTQVVCPMCGATIEAEAEELALHNQIQCDGCDATLEIVELNPIRLEWVEDEDDFEEDDEDDDFV